MGLVWLLIIIVLVFAATAFIKYLLRGGASLGAMEGRKVITLAMIEHSLKLGRWVDH